MIPHLSRLKTPLSRAAIGTPDAILIGLLLTVGLAGCGSAEPKEVIVPPTAPVAPKPVEAATLPDVKFVDITKEAGITFIHTNAATGEKLLPETMGSGAAFFDYDGDGDPDLFLVNSAPWPGQEGETRPTQAFYRNDGKGHFEDVTERAGLDKTFFGMGVAVGDFDNDGDEDLYVTAVGGGHLFRNDGGKFTEVTAETGTHASDGWLTSAAFFDMENDGDLDLFVCQYVDWSPAIDRKLGWQLAGHGRGYGPPNQFGGTFCILLRNDGGKFADVSEEAGIRVRTLDLKVPVAKSLGVAPFDVDGDGLVDLAVANDTVQNFLFHNKGGGKFEEVGMVCGVALDSLGAARGAMGIDWGHFRNDDGLALIVSNFANEMTALYVTDDPKAMIFSDQANVFGLGAPTQPPLKFGTFFFDYDLDGRPDVLTANGHLESDIAKVQASETYRQPAQLFWNTGRPRPSLFAEVGPAKAGPDLFRPIVGRGSAYADIDGDGDLDVVLTDNGGPARLFRNDGGNKNHWLRLRLKGTASNRDALGARVTLRAGDVEQRRQLFPAKGYLSSVELPLTFGLGRAAKADRIAITWPSGKTTELSDVKADQVKVVEEPKAR
jgi:enediyne biosynthesis protein E4